MKPRERWIHPREGAPMTTPGGGRLEPFRAMRGEMWARGRNYPDRVLKLREGG